MAKTFKGIKCPKCGKKGLHYADHPHAYGWKNYDKVACRYCESRFPAPQIEAQRTSRGVDDDSHPAECGCVYTQLLNP